MLLAYCTYIIKIKYFYNIWTFFKIQNTLYDSNMSYFKSNNGYGKQKYECWETTIFSISFSKCLGSCVISSTNSVFVIIERERHHKCEIKTITLEKLNKLYSFKNYISPHVCATVHHQIFEAQKNVHRKTQESENQLLASSPSTPESCSTHFTVNRRTKSWRRKPWS